MLHQEEYMKVSELHLAVATAMTRLVEVGAEGLEPPTPAL
jgi:hypothetical protein